MNDAPKFEFDFSLINNDKRKSSHFEAALKIKAKALFKKIEEMISTNKNTEKERKSVTKTYSRKYFASFLNKIKIQNIVFLQ